MQYQRCSTPAADRDDADQCWCWRRANVVMLAELHLKKIWRVSIKSLVRVRTTFVKTSEKNCVKGDSQCAKSKSEHKFGKNVVMIKPGSYHDKYHLEATLGNIWDKRWKCENAKELLCALSPTLSLSVPKLFEATGWKASIGSDIRWVDATNHRLNKWWPIVMTHICTTHPLWLLYRVQTFTRWFRKINIINSWP